MTLAPDLPPDPPADDPDPATHWLASDVAPAEPGSAGPIASAIGVKFAIAGKIYLYDAGDAAYRVGEEVVVEAERGTRVGTVAVAARRQPAAPGALRRVIRRASRGDGHGRGDQRERTAELHRKARTIARELGLPIKVFRLELGPGGGKAMLYFSSEEKIDFRRFLRELGSQLQLRVELRQTGVRDEAKLVGGIGSCGLELCCSTWLPAFVPVSIKHAKDQGMVLNPTKVSGQCGRLKCCLVYEQATYAELRRGLPKLGKRVVTADGEGRVVEVDVLHRRVRVSLVVGEFKVFAADEVTPLFPSNPNAGEAPDQPS